MSDGGAGDFLARLTAKLSAAGIAHMVVGSFASSFHGVPRSSQDLDLVIDPDGASLQRFLASLPPEEYYADADAAVEALRRRGQFNVIDMATAWKADLIVRKARPFSVEEMRRPIEGDLLGARVRIASAEDTLIAKMEWAQIGGGSELQLRDAAGILSLHGIERIDVAYVERWVRELGLEESWRRLLATSDEEDG
ncbi:MAG TPA: hypothetical protein VN903_36730 [Polyangia bacterium]|jgi:hypothetical protein|nr:hypothetical protein [Polyangia bacterium]